MYEHKYRVLNRHRRGRPRFPFLKKLRARLVTRLGPILLIAGIIITVLFVLDRLGIV